MSNILGYASFTRQFCQTYQKMQKMCECLLTFMGVTGPVRSALRQNNISVHHHSSITATQTSDKLMTTYLSATETSKELFQLQKKVRTWNSKIFDRSARSLQIVEDMKPQATLKQHTRSYRRSLPDRTGSDGRHQTKLLETLAWSVVLWGCETQLQKPDGLLQYGTIR